MVGFPFRLQRRRKPAELRLLLLELVNYPSLLLE